MATSTPVTKIRPENFVMPSDKEIRLVGGVYERFYRFKNQRSGNIRQFENTGFDDYLIRSRELFWNSVVTESEDLKALGLDFSLPFVRKEVLDFLGRISSLNITPQISGSGLSMYGVKVLHAMYKKWRLKSVDRVEKFWQNLYGIVNGTVCIYVGYDGGESVKRFLTAYDPVTGVYQIDERKMKMWDDARTSIVPLEEMYLAKIWQRNIQLQGETQRVRRLVKGEFDAEFGKYPNAKYIQPGNMIAEDSLYFQLLGGTGITTTELYHVIDDFDTDNDQRIIVANGVPLNMLGEGENKVASPNPFHHKMQPYIWAIFEPIDEKFAYGLSMPFKIKNASKLMNTSYTMLVEQELRAIDPPTLTSDIDAPDIIFGQKKVIPVMDVAAYKPFEVREASGAYYTMMNSLQGVMTSHAQGGMSQIAPSKQPKAAREIIALENMKQQALGNTLVLYFNMVYQEIFLVLKTMLQFYESGKYANQEDNLVRTLEVPDFALSQGGIGKMEVRFVKEPQNGLKLYFEGIKKSIENGKATEIIEVPVTLLSKLEFFIDDIRLEPEKATELERAAFFEQVLTPMMQFFIPAGLADAGKTYLRYLEKMGEHPADYTSDQVLPQIMGVWGKGYKLPTAMMETMMGRKGQPAGIGNVNQSTTGTMFGAQSNGGFGKEMEFTQ